MYIECIEKTQFYFRIEFEIKLEIKEHIFIYNTMHFIEGCHKLGSVNDM